MPSLAILLVCVFAPIFWAVPGVDARGDSAQTTSLPFIQARPAGDPHFYDTYGRVRIFHGSNRVKKASPWYFADMLEKDTEFELMSNLGFNVMRLGFMWSGYNPSPGVFNQTYIDTIKAIVDKMAKRGVYTLLDMHEDVLSSKFCLYDGAPRWVIDKSVPKHAFPWPMKGNCSTRGWMMNTLTEAAATAYQDIYDNKHGMLDDLSSFWAHAAEQFVGNPAVIGYEIMNEPFAGNFYEDPTLLLPGQAGRKNLQRMHDAVATAIRKHDDDHLIFYEPVTWGMLFEGKVAGSGFEHVPGGVNYQNRSVFSYHYYCGSFVWGYDKKPALRKAVCDHVTGPAVFEAVKKDLAKLGGAAMMTEGLSCSTRGGTSGYNSSDGECAVVMEMLDKHMFSWTDYDESQGESWSPNIELQRSWARTFARAVAGTPKNMTFNRATKDFEFCFTLDTAIKAPTEIFASRIYSYPIRRTVVTTKNLVVDTEGMGNATDLVMLAPSGSATTGSVGCVWIRNGP